MMTGVAVASMLALALLAGNAVPTTVLEVDVDQPIVAQIEGKPAQLQITTGFIDRLTLHTDYVAANGIKPGAIAGKANVNFWGRKEIEGKNRPLDFTIEGKLQKGRAFWFLGVPQPRYDGSIGPAAIPHDVITVRLSDATDAEQRFEMPLFSGLNNGTATSYQETGFGTAISLSVERELQYPMASAATGAAIASAYGGTLSGEIWQEPIALGVTRPVRLMTLERPFVVGPFAFKQIAVRTRSNRDAAGSGEAIDEAQSGEDVDPQEIVVVGMGKKAKKPAFTFAIGRMALNQCATMSFDKKAKKIILHCRPE